MIIPEKHMLKLRDIDLKIAQLYELRSHITKKLLTDAKEIEVSSYIKVEGTEKPWLRITLFDNKNPFENKNIIYRQAPFQRFEVKIEYLKHEPKAKE